MTNGKRRRQAKLAAEKAAIERRLYNAVAINPDDPLLGQTKGCIALLDTYHQ